MTKPIILTGDRTTGPLHIGHYAGSLRNRLRYQDSHEQFLLLADTQALTDNTHNPGKVRHNVIEVALDYLAVGIDPSRTTICPQSHLPALAELSMLYLNFVTVSRLERNPTIKDEIRAAVRAMFTDPKHVRAEDPGQIEGNVVFSYLDAFDEDQAGLAEIKAQYQRGGLGDGKVKARLEDILQTLIAPIRQRRAQLSKDRAYVLDVIRRGTARARARTEATKRDVIEALGLFRL
ncbi:hypothetical protein [Roseobacter sinensis]|uniref:tryptophan--tRNA ligase n=1 Tax=Roseobacter sinensis TaxID=2931391 RepID=A0ABT3BJL0_9RHOB|nr:hypothetical protein [Roseobacter sp. WL0113]MCV3273765.1 hypothetical protein [Roseobacter sp. WL0113]